MVRDVLRKISKYFRCPVNIHPSCYVFLFLFLSSLALFERTESIAVNAEVNNQMDWRGHQQMTLRVGFDPFLPPFQFEEDGIYKGFNIDILKAVADAGHVDIQLMPMTLTQTLEALSKDEIDVILGIQYKADYYEEMEFTERYYTSSVSMLVSKNDPSITSLSDLSEKIVALQRDTLEYDFLHNIRRIKYHVTSNQMDAFRLFLDGRADAFVGNRITAELLLKEHGLENEYIFVDRYILPLEYTMAVQQQDYSLLQLLEGGLHQIKMQGTYKQIYDQWFFDESNDLKQRIRQMVQLFAVSSLIILMLFLLGARWNRQLKRQVDNKTKDLYQLNVSLAQQITETRNSHQLKEQILDSSPRAIITFDQKGMVTSMNQRAIRILNMEQKAKGKLYNDLPLVSELLDDKIIDVMQKGKQFNGEIKSSHANPESAEEVYLRYIAYPLYDYKHQIAGTILSFEDITEERKLRDQLFEQEKSRALSQLVAGVAHEIRNPLTSIKTFVELIPAKISNARFQQEIMNHVPKEIERLNQLIEGLIDYAKPTRLKLEKVDVADLIQSSTLLFLRVAENKGYLISTSFSANLYIKVDPNQLKQVMINLILNSIEALEERNKDQESQSAATRAKDNKLDNEIHREAVHKVSREVGYKIARKLDNKIDKELDSKIDRVPANKIDRVLDHKIDREQDKKVDNGLDNEITRDGSNIIKVKAWAAAKQGEQRIFIQVQDFGIGMDEIQIKRVFEPFYTTKTKGTGLGLSLSYQYVQENGGDMEIESALGRGTTITLSFKREAKADE